MDCLIASMRILVNLIRTFHLLDIYEFGYFLAKVFVFKDYIKKYLREVNTGICNNLFIIDAWPC